MTTCPVWVLSVPVSLQDGRSTSEIEFGLSLWHHCMTVLIGSVIMAPADVLDTISKVARFFGKVIKYFWLHVQPTPRLHRCWFPLPYL